MARLPKQYKTQLARAARARAFTLVLPCAQAFAILLFRGEAFLKSVFIFVDGLGLAPAGADNPVRPEICPALCGLIESHSVSIDACLGVPGLPQSASGQTTLFTGVNAAQALGAHVEGFPGPSLRRIVDTDNLFMQLMARGLKCRFADAYLADSVEEIAARRFRSVTTAMALSRPSTISLRADLFANNAVFQDITRDLLAHKGYTGGTLSPEVAADHLMQVALANDFTLFEYFQSDRAGHSCDRAIAESVLKLLDAFIGRVASMAEQSGMLFVLTSDHGNIENLSVRTHTLNRIPLIAIGPGADMLLARAASLADVTPLLVEILTGSPMS